MAYRLSRRVRTAALAAGLVGAALVIPTMAAATPHRTPPKPTIDSVQQELGDLAVKSDQLVEKYNQANIAFHAARRESNQAAKHYRVVAAKLAQAREEFSSAAAAQYEGGSFSAAGALLSSDSGSSYLDQLDTLSMLSSHNAQVVSSFAAIQKQAKDAKNQAADLLAASKDKFAAVTQRQTNTKAEIAKYTKLLATLNAEQRALWAAQMNPVVPKAEIKAASSSISLGHITSDQARAAVKFALAQVGKPYVYGAAGPGSYDCSGLTMSAYQAAGISLPHSAADQYNYGHHVAASDLQPGDLMFYYQPIGHVTIYIGNGMMVSAPQTGEDVKVIPADTGGDYTGATRLVS